MTCETFQKQLAEWLDGNLSGAQAGAMREHLNRCPACRRAYAAEQLAARGLRQLSRQKPPRFASWRLYRRIFVLEAERLLAPLRRGLRLPGPVVRYAAGLILAAAVSWVLLARPWHRFPEKPQIYSQQEIRQGLNKARFALSFVLYATKKSQQKVTREVLPREVLLPVRNGIKTTLKSLKIGGKS